MILQNRRLKVRGLLSSTQKKEKNEMFRYTVLQFISKYIRPMVYQYTYNTNKFQLIQVTFNGIINNEISMQV